MHFFNKNSQIYKGDKKDKKAKISKTNQTNIAIQKHQQNRKYVIQIIYEVIGGNQSEYY